MPIRIESSLVMGAGQEGLSVASALAQAGIGVTLLEADEGAADRARFFLRGSAGRIDFVNQWESGRSLDFVFDALEGSDPIRASLFERLEEHLPEQAILATTSTLPTIKRSVPKKLHANLIGFRFSEPSFLRKLIEIEIAPDVNLDVVAAAFNLARDLGKLPVSVPAGRRSTYIRLRDGLFAAVETILLQGAIPHEVDEAMVAFGFDLGPCEAQDLIGLDALSRLENSMPSNRNECTAPISERMVQEGRLGKKVGVGWYRYPGGGGAVIDPLIEDLIREEARFANVEQREFTSEDIVNRLLLSLFNEGVKALESGGVKQASEIDLISVHGIGFPSNLVGIMSYGSEVTNRH